MSGTRSGRVGGARPGAGRPKGSVIEKAPKEAKDKLAELARAHTEAAIATLVETMKNGSTDAARVSAATALLDRGYGKPAQAHMVSGDEESPVRHSIEVIYRDMK